MPHAQDVAERAEEALRLRGGGEETGRVRLGEEGFEAAGVVRALVLQVRQQPGVLARQGKGARAGGFAAGAGLAGAGLSVACVMKQMPEPCLASPDGGEYG